MPPTIPPDIIDALRRFSESWASNDSKERTSFSPWLTAFCRALDLPTPGSPPSDDDCFERSIKVTSRDTGKDTPNFIDYWKAGHVAIEAKASGSAGSNDLLLRKAFGQVKSYIAEIGSLPPYLIVVDVPSTLIIWDRWNGAYGDFAAGRRIALRTLHERPEDVALLRDAFVNPGVRDPRGRAQAVSREIAGKLATLSATLESRGFEPERVARFLMRCVFCFFAEDVDLLPKGLFQRTLETAQRSGNAARVAQTLTSLWQTMDQGGMFGAEELHKFNGHFFKSVEALPLEPADVTLMIEAARFDWSAVEPSIFGTLLVRALDPVERHRLGAEYTPREYIERLVEPTVVEPIRERWTAVQGAVLQLEATEKKKDRDGAIQQLRDFHAWMRGLQFLDPACGSGNFLYVTMAAVKRIELEVLHEIERVGGREQTEAVLDEVHPRQFHGIEIKPWAREIAELTLWIGYHQFWREAHGGRTPPDPILEDTGTIECRDAVLAWDSIVHRPEKDRPDPTPRITSPVTGELIPDPTAKLKYMEYVNPRPAEWPKADFIVGNPPYIGNKRMRESFGDGYAEAVRAVYESVPESADFVMYWWARAARLVATGDLTRAGLITTNSIGQIYQQGVVRSAAAAGARVVWAIRDHPWTDGSDEAAVRVAMTVLANSDRAATLVSVNDAGEMIARRVAARMNADLSMDADVSTASGQSLEANEGLVSRGFQLVGAGFILEAEEAERVLAMSPELRSMIRPYRNGKDLTSRPRGVFVIDLGLRDEAETRAIPMLFDILRDRVKPDRDANARASYARLWWRFGEPRREFRAFTAGLPRYIATPQTAKHRFFTFLATAVAPDDMVVTVGSSDPFHLGALSAQIHVHWALAAGARLGVGNDPRYNQSRCFDPFPFPDPTPAIRTKIGALAERLDAHRKEAIARDERVTMTGMYNVVEKLRSGEALTIKERAIHEIAACGILRDMHDELDALVASAYGWPWPMEKEEILERLVKLHDERVEEEKRGQIRWLRPEYQVPRFAPKDVAAKFALPDSPVAAVAVPKRAWPATAVDQLAAIGSVLGQRPLSIDDVIAEFAGAKRELVARHLETLALMGEVVVDAEGRYGVSRKAA